MCSGTPSEVTTPMPRAARLVVRLAIACNGLFQHCNQGPGQHPKQQSIVTQGLLHLVAANEPCEDAWRLPRCVQPNRQ
jgi:hypothetical protein